MRPPPRVGTPRISALRGGGPQAALAQRQSREAVATGMAASLEEVVGIVPVIGTGEVLLEVNFPVLFTGEDLTIYGSGALVTPEGAPTEGDLFDILGLTQGSFPTWQVGVAAWRTTVVNDVAVTTGAAFAIVVTGTSTQESVVSFTVRGMALRNPVS